LTEDPRIGALPDSHGHAKGEHKAFADERPIPYTARMLFLWFYHACRRGAPRFMMVADHINYLTFEDPAAVHVVRRALKLAQAGDLYGAAETAGVELGHASVVSEGLRKGMRYSIGAEVDNDPRSRPDAQNIVDAMKPDGLIRSVHFLPITHPQHGENWMWAFDNPEFKEFYEVVGTERVWEIYMETLLDAIDKLPGHIVGHFYVPAKFGHWPDDPTLEAYEDRLIDACAERGMAVEVNSRYLYKYYVGDDAQLEKFRTAHLRLMRKAKAKGVMVAVGSDAHSPRDQGGAFEAVLALLDEADINEIAFPLNDRLARVALRATEEILRQHSAALAAALPQANVRPRVGLPPDPAEDDDGSDDDTEREAEPRIESANPDAEIILPPSPEPEPEPEEPAVAATPKVKAPPKPRKSRAKVPVAAEAPVESAPIVEPAASAAAAAIESQPAVVTAEAAKPAIVAAPAPAAAHAPAAAPVVATAKAAKPVAESKPLAAKAPPPKPIAKPPVAKRATKVVPPKAAASKAAPLKKAEPAPKKAPPAKPAPKKSAAPAKKAAPVKKAAPAKKAAPPKASAKKAAKKKAPVKKTPAKKSVAKKPTAKPAAKKTARTSATSAKRPAAKRPAPKKTAAKKTAKKKSARR
jgi:HisJ family histidinol phosphate phosphatase